MNIFEFEELLGTHISTFETTIGNEFENKLFGETFYYTVDEFVKKDFFNIKYNIMTISKNEDNMVRSISIHFREIINKQFYDLFVEKYGEPDHTYVMSNMKVVSEGLYKSDDGFSSNLRKREGDLVEGTFDDKPLAIIWEKDGYYIQAFLRHEQNISEIMFSLDSPPFNVKPNKEN
ncbi:hypothetical protein U6A24_05915 [Aquimarina gracilis]|uniref:Uncharacterized protein n=1 Tax=Aquimarina gracilis TaxID=874422 RepID=A0ABU5ZSE2_9FLAO|nr:hypothetical protein [Aquimarina gracilis]MEB3344985.1 hypothetical protein [Aquimarina gracilis]